MPTTYKTAGTCTAVSQTRGDGGSLTSAEEAATYAKGREWPSRSATTGTQPPDRAGATLPPSDRVWVTTTHIAKGKLKTMTVEARSTQAG